MKRNIILITLVVILVLIVAFLYWAKTNHKLFFQATGGNPTLTLTPANSTTVIGSNMDVNIVLDTDGSAVSGVKIFYLHYDPAVFDVIDADPNTASTQITKGSVSNFEIVTDNNVNESSGTISYIVSTVENYYTGNDVLATINFKSKKQSASSTLTFDFEEGSLDKTVVADTTGKNILSSVGVGIYDVTAATPTLNLLIDGKSSVNKDNGSQATISWSSTNVTTCVALGGWNGNITPVNSGSKVVGPLLTSQNFSLDCKGPGGNITSNVSITVNGVPPPLAPTLDFNTEGQQLINKHFGEEAILSWATNNATICRASNAWSGDKNISGDETTGKLTQTSTYELTCDGEGGQVSQSIVINVAESTSSDKTTEPNSSKLTPTSSQNISFLPENIKPIPIPASVTIKLDKNSTMKPWILWLSYLIIPAILTGIGIYFSIRRNQKLTKNKKIN